MLPNDIPYQKENIFLVFVGNQPLIVALIIYFLLTLIKMLIININTLTLSVVYFSFYITPEKKNQTASSPGSRFTYRLSFPPDPCFRWILIQQTLMILNVFPADFNLACLVRMSPNIAGHSIFCCEMYIFFFIFLMKFSFNICRYFFSNQKHHAIHLRFSRVSGKKSSGIWMQ